MKFFQFTKNKKKPRITEGVKWKRLAKDCQRAYVNKTILKHLGLSTVAFFPRSTTVYRLGWLGEPANFKEKTQRAAFMSRHKGKNIT